MYSKKTNDIKVTATPIYIDEQSSPQNSQYVWAYHIVIENLGTEIVQLISRYWRITDALGNVQEVRGPGVVGEQPVIRPGDFYEYTSGTNLKRTSLPLVPIHPHRPIVVAVSGDVAEEGIQLPVKEGVSSEVKLGTISRKRHRVCP